MANGPELKSLAGFLLRLALLLPICLAIWWLCLVLYTTPIAHAAALLLKYVARYPVEQATVTPAGILNTKSTIDYTIGGRNVNFEAALIVSNSAVFLALVLATARLPWNRRLALAGAGLGILAAAQILYVVLFLVFKPTVERHLEATGAIGQLFVILPLPLWMALVYWRRATPNLPHPPAPSANNTNTPRDPEQP